MSLRGMIEALRDFDTPMLANTIGYIDPTPPHLYYMSGAIRSVTPGLGPTVGVAVTCEIDTSTPAGAPDMEGYWSQLEEIERMDEPVVWVVRAVGSRPEHECIVGEGMSKTLYAAGCIGLVTNGGVRDLRGLLATPFAAYCRGPVVHHAALRIRAMGKSIEVGGITVHPGDVIHADAEGVIRIPRGCLEALPAKAAKMRALEHDVHGVWRRTDVSLAEKRKRGADLFAESGFGRTAGGDGHELER